MANLTRASTELFRRSPDERLPSLQALWQHCYDQKERSTDRWRPPRDLRPEPDDGRLTLSLGDGNEPFTLNDWSFSQICRFAGVAKETVNRLSADTASRVLRETLPGGNKPFQVFTEDDRVRSVHGTGYTRLHNADLVTMLREFATDFQPPPRGFNGATGLYAGEQDLFVFLIDPTGWAEIDGEAFAPGFFVWNSEVGARSVGIQTFWFQQICQNHIVWDAVEVVDFARKHTGNVHEALGDIRRHVETLVTKRDERRDGFMRVMRAAMEQKLGDDAEDVLKALAKHGMAQKLAKRAVEAVEQGKGRFTLFTVIDALTRLARELPNAGDRSAADEQASRLLSLVA
jgi:hypothetical protein